MTIRKDTALTVRYLVPPAANNAEKRDETGIYIDLAPEGNISKRLRKYLAFETRREGEWCDLTIYSLRNNLQLKGNFEGSQIVELGAYCKHMQRAEDHALEHTGMVEDRPQLTGTKGPFMYLGELIISGGTPPPYTISSISTDISSNGWTRLSWKIAADIVISPREIAIPFSAVTGPFAYFLIYFDGELQGVAHAMDFVLSKSFIGQGPLGLGFSVQGVMWNGEIIASS